MQLWTKHAPGTPRARLRSQHLPLSHALPALRRPQDNRYSLCTSAYLCGNATMRVNGPEVNPWQVRCAPRELRATSLHGARRCQRVLRRLRPALPRPGQQHLQTPVCRRRGLPPAHPPCRPGCTAAT